MGAVIPLPGIDPGNIRPRPTCMAELPQGASALVVESHQSGFAVEVRPGEPDWTRRQTFPSHRKALQFARRTAACNPKHFQLIIDETVQGRSSLDHILGPGPDPMGLGGAA